MANEQNLIPAKKGEVRNPKGKPKGTIHLSTRIQRMMDDPDFTTDMIGKDGKKFQFKGNPAEAIIKTAILKAMSGDKNWADWLAKYGYSLNIEVSMSNPIQLIIEKYGNSEGVDEVPPTTTDESRPPATDS